MSFELKSDEWKLKFQNEFAQAKAYFDEQESLASSSDDDKIKPPIKMRRKNSSLPYSFIKINGEIYAMEPHEYVGVGGSAKVKRVRNANGDVFALKIEAVPRAKNQLARTLFQLGYLRGYAERKLPSLQKFYKGTKQGQIADIESEFKSYTLMELKKGFPLDEIISGIDKTNANIASRMVDRKTKEIQNLIVALKCCLAVLKLHQAKIIHADIKPNNFIVNIPFPLAPYELDVSIIDFGNAKLLDKDKNTILAKPGGTEGFKAPEIVNANSKVQDEMGTYSFASDIYALGCTFEQLFANESNQQTLIISRMKIANPAKRLTLEDVIHYFMKELELKINDDPIKIKYNKLPSVAKARINPDRIKSLENELAKIRSEIDVLMQSVHRPEMLRIEHTDQRSVKQAKPTTDKDDEEHLRSGPGVI